MNADCVEKMMTMFKAAFVLSIACVLSTGAWAEPAPTAARPMAVLFFADWCYNCKQIKPKLAELEAAYGDRIRFERLDVTSDETKIGAREHAKALGIAPIYLANKGTGLVALIDTAHHKVGELRSTMSVEEMREALDDLVMTNAPPPSARVETGGVGIP